MKLIAILLFLFQFLVVLCQVNEESDTVIYPQTNLFQGSRIVEIHQNDFLYKGLTSDSISIKPEGIWVMLNQNGDTLWYTKYGFEWPYVAPGFSYLPEYTQIKNVFQMDEVDILPLKSDSSSITDTIRKEHLKNCRSSAGFEGVRTIRFIVDSTGKVWNIEQHQGAVNFLSCPYFIQALILEVSDWKKLIPATKNGNNVNVKIIVPIDNMDVYMNMHANHPAYNRPRKTLFGVPLFSAESFDF